MSMMIRGTAIAFLVSLAVAHAEPPKPKFKLSKETTYITEPLDKDGYLDYETALNERLRGKITPETNAVVLMCQVFGPKPEGAEMHADFYKWLGIAAPPEKGEYFVGLEHFVRNKTGKPLETDEYDALSVTFKKPWTEKEFPVVAEWLNQIEKPLGVIEKAVERKEYFYPLLSTRTNGRRGMLLGALMPHVQKNRSVANALVSRAMLRMGEGKFDAAWKDLMLCERLGRLVSRGGTHIETLAGNALVANAIAGQLVFVERHKPNTQQALALIQELQSLPDMPTLVEKMDRSERFVLLDITQSIRRNGSEEGDDFGNIPKKPGPEREAALDLLDWETTFKTVLENYDRAIAIAREPNREKRNALLAKFNAELDEEVQTIRQLVEKQQNLSHLIGKQIGLTIISLMLPAIDRIENSHIRIEQQHRNLQLAFALAAFHADNAAFPAKLDDLAPKYLAKIPNDLFAEKPLIYQPTENGYLLYSVGENGKDDGGATFGDEPKGDDLRVRMPMNPVK